MRCSLLVPAGFTLLQLCAATPYDRDSAVRSLAVLGSTTVERACLAVLVAPQFLAAPAHCVVSFTRRSGQQLEFASFGFYLDTVPPVTQGDSVGNERAVVPPPTRGAFNETERIRITHMTLHPDFTIEVEPEGFMANDWAVLQLEHAPLATNITVATVGDNVGDNAETDAESTDRHFLMEPLPFLDDAVSELSRISSYFGAVFVESESLALTWVKPLRLDNPVETCGLAQPVTTQPAPTPISTTISPVPATAAPVTSTSASGSATTGEPEDEVLPEEEFPEPVISSDIVCVTSLNEDSPPLPTATTTVSTNWLGSLLLTEHYTDPGYFVAGFGSSHVDLPNTQSFTWAEATGPEFLGKPLILDTHWVNVQAYASLIGYQVPVLESNMKFMTGIRMTRKGENYCGASLIAPTFVLTAAHCLDDSNLDGSILPWVSISSLKTSGVEYGEQIRVIKAIRHPLFDSVKLTNDLALLELKYPSVAAPVKLFNSHPLPLAGQIFGYGVTTSWGIMLSDVLRFVDVNIYASNQKCMLDLQMNIDDTMFCAGGQVDKDACDGDSGGPLVVADAQGETALLGVISYGRGCGAEYLPGVYANVSQGLEFIKSIVPEVKWTSSVANVKGPVDKGSSASHSGGDPVQPVNLGTPSSTAGSERGGDDGETTTKAAGTSGHQFANTTDQGEYVLPDTLAPAIREAVIEFLIGKDAQISSSLALLLLDPSNQIVFQSSESLAALEKIITKFNEKPLHQRKVRLNDNRGSKYSESQALPGAAKSLASKIRRSRMIKSTATPSSHLTKKPTTRPLKYYESPAFLRKESAFDIALGSCSSGSSHDKSRKSPPPAPWYLGQGVSESYRLVATVARAVEKSALLTRPFSWGYGWKDGALAHNNTQRIADVKVIAFFRNEIVRSVSAGNCLSLFLTESDRVYQSGRLAMKQVGCGMWAPRELHFESTAMNPASKKPTSLKSRIVVVEAGHHAGYALDNLGRVYSWGTHEYGQLGFESAYTLDESNSKSSEEPNNQQSTKEDTTSEHNDSDTEDEKPKEPQPRVVIVEKAPKLIPFFADLRITKLSAGNHFTLAISTLGHVYSWGRNCDSQLGLGEYTSSTAAEENRSFIAIPKRIDALAHLIAVDVSAGHSHALGIFVSRSYIIDVSQSWQPGSVDFKVVYSWGRGQNGRLGLGGSQNEPRPREVRFFRGLNATQVAAGNDHSLVLCGVASQSFLYAFGGNKFGQLGVASLEDHIDMPNFVAEFTNMRIVSIGAGARYSVALTGDGELFTWGDAMYGKTHRSDLRTTFVPWKMEERENASTNSSSVTFHLSSKFVTQVSVGAHHSLGLFRLRG